MTPSRRVRTRFRRRRCPSWGADGEQVSETLEQIVSLAARATTSADQIGLATRQQTSASHQVVAAMTQVADVAETQANGQLERVEQIQLLDAMAEDLHAAIAMFRGSL